MNSLVSFLSSYLKEGKKECICYLQLWVSCFCSFSLILVTMSSNLLRCRHMVDGSDNGGGKRKGSHMDEC